MRYNKTIYYIIIILKPIIRYFLFLTILPNVQNLSISPGNRSLDNPEFLS